MKRLISAALLLVAHQAISQTIVLKNINVLDVKNLTVNQQQTIVIKDKHIISVGRKGSLTIPENAIVFDMTGKYVSPGLIDSHVHHGTDPDGFDNDRDSRKRLRTLIRGGVTSVRDMGGDTRALNSLARRAMLDQIQSPDIYYSVIIGGAEFFADPRTVSSAKGMKSGNTPWMKAVDDETALDQVMLMAKGTGATGIKIYAKVPGHLMEKLSKAAKKHQLKVWSHAYVGPAKPSEAIAGGVETISHAPDLAAEIIENYENWRRKNIEPNAEQEKRSYNEDEYQRLLALMKQKETILDATLTVFEKRKNSSKNSEKRYQHAKMLTRLSHEKGIKISAGTDAFSDEEVQLYHELTLLVEDAGLTPFESLQAATIHGAEVIGIENEYGSIEKNKIANLVVYNENPSESLSALTSIAHVIKNGQFIYRGADSRLPFIPAKKAAGTLWMSGQLGNLPGTMKLAGETIDGQMHQTMKNIGYVLQEYNLSMADLTKCTVMLSDIKDWSKASDIYKTYFTGALPTRSAFAASGLALNAKVEIECFAAF